MKGLHFKEEVLFIDNLAVIDLQESTARRLLSTPQGD